MQGSKVIQAIAVTAELCGRSFTPAAARVFAQDLAGFPDEAVMAALTRCRKEVKGILTVQDVVSRIDDGRPGVEQAWAMIPHDEKSSVVWTQEMAHAYGVAAPLLIDGDRIGARMAFKEAYAKAVADARDRSEAPKWTPSFGGDPAGRQMALIDAVRAKRLTLKVATGMLAAYPDLQEGLLISVGATNHPLLAAPSPDNRKRLQDLLGQLKALK